MAEYCSQCSPFENEFDLFNIALKIKRGHSFGRDKADYLLFFGSYIEDYQEALNSTAALKTIASNLTGRKSTKSSYTDAYGDRGASKANLGQYQGAIADYEKAEQLGRLKSSILYFLFLFFGWYKQVMDMMPIDNGLKFIGN